MERRRFITGAALAVAGIGLGGSIYWPRRWKYIVIHHSAGNYGDIAFLKKVHRERQARDPVDAIPYHYIIGNGNGLAMGEIAHGWRQTRDVWGAHVSARNMDRNYRGIGICLIGNYEKGPVPKLQYQALLGLTRSLMQQYDIPASNVAGHGYILGEATKCPGKYFPMVEFLHDIAQPESIEA